MSRKPAPYHPYSRDNARNPKDSGRSFHGPMRERGKSSNEDSSDPRSYQERPTRTLFVRNVNYNVSEKQIRDLFEPYGEVKRVFNLIEKRGMAFVTYFNSKDAERAKNALQNTELNGRSIDVHYALPKEDGTELYPEDKNTGTLFVTFRNLSRPPTLSEIRQFFEKWGELREIRDCKNSPNQRFIEYYDLRDCEKAYEEAIDKPFLDGTLDVKYAFLQKKTSKEEKPKSRDDRDNYHTANIPMPLPSNPYPSNPLLSPNNLMGLNMYPPVDMHLSTSILPNPPLGLDTQGASYLLNNSLNFGAPNFTQLPIDPNAYQPPSIIPTPQPATQPANAQLQNLQHLLNLLISQNQSQK